MPNVNGKRKTRSISVDDKKVTKVARQLASAEVPKDEKTADGIAMDSLKRRGSKVRAKKLRTKQAK